MKKLYLLCSICFFLALNDLKATTVVIIESASYGHTMDNQWLQVCTGLGYNAAIYPQTKLDSTNWFGTTDVLIVSSGVIPLTTTGVNTIQAFLLQGGRVYLQCEYQTSYTTNIAFQQIINANGGNFNWIGTTTGTLAPMNILGSLSTTPNTIPPLTYFWYGTNANPGCNANVESFMEYQGSYYGFIFCVPSNNSRMIGNSDQDWVQSGTSIPLMQNIAMNLASPAYTCVLSSGGMSVNLGPDTAICNGSSVTLDGTTAGATSYLWSTGEATASISVDTSGTYWVQVSNGICTGSDTIVVTAGNTLSIIASGDTSVCVGSALHLFASTVNGATYTWTGPNNFNIQNPVIPVTTFADSGTYTVVASIGGCTSNPVSVHVAINPVPPAPVASNNGPLSVGDSLLLSASSIPGATYSWTGPNNFNQQNPILPNVTLADSGAYTVVVTVNGCSSVPATTFVTINPCPAAPLVSNNGPLCIGDSLKLSASTVNGATYAWTGPNNFNQQNPVVPNVTLADSGIYTLIVTIGACSSNPISTSVHISNPPGAPVATNTGPVCAGSTVQLNASNIPGATYTWTGPNNFNQQNPTIANASAADSGVYTVIASIGGCNGPAATTLLIITPAPAAPTVSNNSPICAGSTLQLSASNIAGATYTWTGPNNFNQQNPSIANATVADSGTYSVVVTIGNCSSNPVSTLAVVNPAPAAPVITASDTVICSSDSSQLCISGTFSTYVWNTGAGTPCIYAHSAGNYYASVTDANGCSAQSNHLALTVKPVPPVSISVNGDTLTCNTPGTYQWYFNGNAITTATSPVYIAAQPGVYTLLVTSSNGCSTLSSGVIVNSVGIEPVTGNAPFEVYPSPVSDQLVIQLGSDIHTALQIEIFDAIGQRVAQNLTEGPKTTMSVSNFATGVYFVRIGEVVRRFLKE